MRGVFAAEGSVDVRPVTILTVGLREWIASGVEWVHQSRVFFLIAGIQFWMDDKQGSYLVTPAPNPKQLDLVNDMVSTGVASAPAHVSSHTERSLRQRKCAM